MNRITPLIFLYPLICFLSSCKKDSRTETSLTNYRAVLVDATTRAPIPNHKIYLVKSDSLYSHEWELADSDTFLLMPNTPTGAVDSTITEVNGTFSFPYPLNTTPEDFLNKYWPGLAGNDSIFCTTSYLYRGPGQAPVDTFLTEKTLYLKIKMQKSTPAEPSDLTFQHVSLYKVAAINIPKVYYKGQAGMTNHTVVLPYSKNFADYAVINWHYRGLIYGVHEYDTVMLQPMGSTLITLDY